VKIIEEELLPPLILSTECGYDFNPNDMQLRSEDHGVISNIVVVRVVRPTMVDAHTLKNKIDEYINKITNLSEEKRSWLLKALRFWNRGSTEPDNIDKFIDYYIAFEIFVNRVIGGKPIHELEQQYNIKLTFNGYQVNIIRAAILHGSHKKKLLIDEAIKIADKHVEEFGKNLWLLIQRYLTQTH